jgi:capsular exopolysaccharide synthesis family protein
MSDKHKILRFQELFYPLRKYWLLALAGCLVVIVTVVVITIYTPRVYRTSATLLVKQGNDTQGQLFEISNVILQKYMIKNQVAILESRSLAESVVQKLEASSNRDSLELLGFVPRTAKRGPSWWSALFSNRTENRPRKPSFQQTVKEFQSSVRVSYGRDSDLIELSAEAPTPGEATLLVNTWVEAYMNFNSSDSRGEFTQTKDFLESKLKDMEEKLNVSETALSSYQKQNHVVSLSNETQQLVAQVSSFESLYNQTKTDLEALTQENAFLKGKLDSSKRHLVQNMLKLSNPLLSDLQKDMARLAVEKAAYEAQLIGAGYDIRTDSKWQQMENRLNGIKRKIVEETRVLLKNDLANLNPLDRSESLITQILQNETTLKSLVSKQQSLIQVLSEFEGRMSSIPDKSLDLARLERDVQVNNKIYIMLREKYEETRIREASQVNLIQIVDRAEPPAVPIRPKTRLNCILAALFGVLFGIALAYTRSYFDRSVRKAQDLRDLDIPILGEIPATGTNKVRKFHLRRDAPKLVRAKQVYPDLLLRHKEQSPLTETYRAIRTKLLLTRKQRKWNTILFTSSNPGEGKSTTAANIGIMMARNGIKTLIVDSDLRRPVLDVLFTGSHRNAGLTRYLNRKQDWQDAVRETSVKELFLLPSGTDVKNAPELLSSNLMFRFIEEAKKAFGMVLFDSPPLLPVTDAAVLSTLLDGIVMIVRSSRTTRDDLLKAMQILHDMGGHVLGGVLTDVHKDDLTGYRDRYQGY